MNIQAERDIEQREALPSRDTTKGGKVATRTETRRARLTAVAGAMLAALAVWVLAEGVFGVEVRAAANGGAASYDIGQAMVAVTSGLAALAGWGLLAALEHFVIRARAIWTVVASLVLVGSFAGPLASSGITGANRGALLAMHIAVGAVLIPGMYRTARSGEADEHPANPSQAQRFGRVRRHLEARDECVHRSPVRTRGRRLSRVSNRL